MSQEFKFALCFPSHHQSSSTFFWSTFRMKSDTSACGRPESSAEIWAIQSFCVMRKGFIVKLSAVKLWSYGRQFQRISIAGNCKLLRVVWKPTFNLKVMEKQDAQILADFVWPKFFPKDKFMLQDKRIAAIAMFCDFFKKDGKAFLNKLDATQEKSLYFDVSSISQLLPFPDFIDTLRTRPNEVIGCLGCAISILKTKDYSSNLSEPFCIWPRFQNFKEDCSFSDLKSGSVGQLVCIRGYVVKVSPCRPLIEGVSSIK